MGSLPTLGSLAECLASADPSAFYLPRHDTDFLEAADLTLQVSRPGSGGTGGDVLSLPVHRAVVALRAPAFSPLLGMAAGQVVASPFGIEDAPSLLLLLRLCYQPGDAAQLGEDDTADLLPGKRGLCR